jgi:hypothetical protein
MRPAPAPSNSMRRGSAGGKAVPSFKLTHPASRHVTSKRGALVTTHCLQCAAQQIFRLPRLQQTLPHVRPSAVHAACQAVAVRVFCSSVRTHACMSAYVLATCLTDDSSRAECASTYTGWLGEGIV